MDDSTGQQVIERVYCVAGGLLGACNIPAAQALTLAAMIVEVFSDMERLQHEAD